MEHAVRGTGGQAVAVLAACLVLTAGPPDRLTAQDTTTAAVGRDTRVGVFGFGTRGGIDFKSKQLVLGVTLDGGDILGPRFRLRPSGEVGVFNGANTFAASLEALYRFTPDHEAAVPYLGGGLAMAGHDRCGADPGCPSLWINLVLGFELRFRSTFNWLVEYHGMDAMRRHRLYVGLTTRRADGGVH